jgi:serine/threonine-protein kinase SRPK3
MVFEILGVNLLEVLKRYDYKGLPLDLVKEITRQVLMGLDFLNRICRVIHTDLKPENVLLCLTPDEIRKIV